VARILYVEANEDGTVGGSHKILYDLVVRLSSEYEPVVLFYEDNIWAERLRERGVEVVTWDEERGAERRGLKEGGKISTATTLVTGAARRRTFIRSNRIDMVHLNNSPFVGHDDWLPAARLAGVPCVVYCMGDLRYESNAIRRFASRTYDAYFPLSRLVLEAFAYNGIAREKMYLAYPGVDLEEADSRVFRPADDVRSEFGLRPDQLLVTMVGNVRRWKGQLVVVEGLAGLSAEDRARIHVLFVGEEGGHAEYVKELQEAIARHDLGGVVEFTGRREDVPDILEASDIAIHASIQPEPFGLVVQEAMLHGCATVAADQGGPVEMLTPESGRMFDAADPPQLTRHLQDLIRDELLRSRLSEAARIQARTFDVHRHVEIIEQQYRRLLN
jgi:glycosyltransferase involved in cell wall biosynthesis